MHAKGPGHCPGPFACAFVYRGAFLSLLHVLKEDVQGVEGDADFEERVEHGQGQEEQAYAEQDLTGEFEFLEEADHGEDAGT